MTLQDHLTSKTKASNAFHYQVTKSVQGFLRFPNSENKSERHKFWKSYKIFTTETETKQFVINRNWLLERVEGYVREAG